MAIWSKDRNPYNPEKEKSKPDTSDKWKSKGLSSGSANVAEHSDDEFGAGAWIAHPTVKDSDCESSDDDFDAWDTDETDNEMPGLNTVSDSESEFSDDESALEDDLDSLADDHSDFSDNDEDTEDTHPSIDDFYVPLENVELPEATDDAFAGATGLKTTESVELFNSGASRHMSPHRDHFASYRDIHPKSFDAANQQTFEAIGQGDIILDLPNGRTSTAIRLTDVLYAPALTYTLISIGRLDNAGYTTTFGGGVGTIFDGSGEVIGIIPKSKGLYRIVQKSESEGTAHAVLEKLTVMELHRRLGHAASSTVQKLVKNGLVDGIELDLSVKDPEFCETCVFAKAKRQSIPKQREGPRATEYGAEIHSNVWGPASVQSIGGRRYFVTFTDDYSRDTHVYLLKK